MQKGNKDKKTRRERIDAILRQASARKLSDQASDMTDRYLLENENDPELRDALRERYESQFRLSRKPSREALESLSRMLFKLGFKPEKANPTTEIRPHSGRQIRRIMGAAATIAVIVTAGILFIPGNKKTEQIAEHCIELIEGVNKDIRLADSTHIWINEKSTLTYPREFGEKRHVKLAGHARFNVAHDSVHPFHVHTKHLEVCVLGTDFHVKEDNEAQYTEIVLYKGAVEVKTGKRSRRLIPGQRLKYEHLTGEIEVSAIRTDTLEQKQYNHIFARHKTIPELLHMVANYYDVKITFDPAAFDGEKYMFGFDKKDPIQKVMDVIGEMGGGFGYEFNRDSTEIEIKTTN